MSQCPAEEVLARFVDGQSSDLERTEVESHLDGCADCRLVVASVVSQGRATEATRPEHDALLGRMLGLAPKLMRQLGVENGYRTVINTGRDGGQEVYHLHMHVMGGPRPWLKG